MKNVLNWYTSLLIFLIDKGNLFIDLEKSNSSSENLFLNPLWLLKNMNFLTLAHRRGGAGGRRQLH